MFSKFLKKNPAPAEVLTEPPREIEAGVAWESRLQAAACNDTELLALAIDAPSVDHKLSAVQALGSEESLRIAEREFRKHDRRVHSLAKQRYESMVKQRETRATAAELIQSAAVLLEAPVIPANRLAELNQTWEQLDHALIEDEDKSRFTKLQTDLAELIRERGEHKRTLSRWSTAANQALKDLNSAIADVTVAGTGLPEFAALLATASEQARATLAEMPTNASSQDDALAVQAAAIESALQDSTLIATRLEILGELQSCLLPQPEPLHEENSGAPPENILANIAADIPAALIQRWKSLPPIAHPHMGKFLSTRFDECLDQQDTARKQQQKQSNRVASEKSKAVQQTQLQALKIATDAAEAALAAGHLDETEKQLTSLQKMIEKGGGSGELQTRISALQSEFSRLKGWQHWGGGRVRDDLVVEAEALAASTVTPEVSTPVKLHIKKLDDNIAQLRARWKELDRLGGATSKPLWQRFDTALKTAHLPVAAHLTILNEARQENLAARNKLLDVLDALDISADDHKIPDWKEINRALAHFQTEWRKLGPLEHTVPHKSQRALQERINNSVSRLENPLKEVQVSAQAEREQLVVRAKTLCQNPQGKDVSAKLRELQAQWQSHAKTQPLPRKMENRLWAEFRAAIDALMNQREAAFNARDAELKANLATRETLIARLEVLDQDTLPADINKILASVDTEWRNAGEAPKNQADRLESKYRAAREQARGHIAGSARRSWQHTCDALLAKLALCEELESAAPSAQLAADIKSRWESLPALPLCWEQPLRARYQSGCENPGVGIPENNGAALDQLLLQLESSLAIPSPAAFQAARQKLKLLAMKDAMEGRSSATPSWPEIEAMTATVISHTPRNPDQRGRLLSIIAAIRNSEPESL